MSDVTGGRQPGWTPSGRCSIFACDIIAFGDVKRVDHIQGHLREQLYKSLARGFDQAGVSFDECYAEDRGDGTLVVPRSEVPLATLISPLTEHLDGELRRQHAVANEVGAIRLRVALHAGEVNSDSRGISGKAVNHAFRLLEARLFKDAVAESGARLSLIVSQELYDDTVQHGVGMIDPADYEQIAVENKETKTTGWMRLLGVAGPTASPNGDGTPVPTDRDRSPVVADPVEVGKAEFEPGADDFFSPRFLTPTKMNFALAEQLLNIPIMGTERGRDRVIGLLRDDISRMVSRHAEARMDAYCLIEKCMDHRGGIEELIAVLKEFEGNAASVRRFEEMVRRLLG